MKTSPVNLLKRSLKAANQWFRRTPERALDEAYDAALRIRSIEETHFNGQIISTESSEYGESVQAYFQAELKKYLNIIKIRLTEFRTSKSILEISNQINGRTSADLAGLDSSENWQDLDFVDQPAIYLEKLKFIDTVISPYTSTKSSSTSLVPFPDSLQEQTTLAEPAPQLSNSSKLQLMTSPTKNSKPSNSARASSSVDDVESLVDKTGVLPRSILKTVDRIKRELDPKAEEEVVENFRNSKARTIISLRIILLLITIPLLTQQLTKIVIVGPIVDRFRDNEQAAIFLNREMEEEALLELHLYEERLKFHALIGGADALSSEEMEEKLHQRAIEIQEVSRQASNDAIKNVFADIFSVAAFVILILNSKRELAVLKSFFDELVYGLSDSAKAFIIILLTDIFVGFHSPHGWEVLLEGISRHLGLPANRNFIFLFIATFPVILDTIFKYWIFRYLNRISPSAVATYRNMNE
jgi:hypothetical protein